MGNWQTLTITGKTPAVRLVDAGDQSTLIANNDINNPIWISDDPGMFAGQQTAIQLTPQSVLVVDGKTDIYGVANAGQSVAVNLIPGGMSFFQSTILGTNFILNSKGFFLYSGLPAHGNLIASIAPIAGTDQFGNAYLNGFTSYDVTGQEIQHSSHNLFFINPTDFAAALITIGVVLSGVDALELTSPSPTSGTTQAVLNIVAGPSGGGTGQIQITNALLMISRAINPPAVTSGRSFIYNSATDNLLFVPFGPLVELLNSSLWLATAETPAAPATGVILSADPAGRIIMTPPAGSPNNLRSAKLTTFPNNSITSGTKANLTSGLIIGNDAEVGSTYELECSGHWTEATTTALSFTFSGGFGSVGTSVNQTIAPTGFNPGGTGRFYARIRATCHTTGVTGTWLFELFAWMTPNANPNNTVTICDVTILSAAVTADTTVNQSLQLQGNWASAVNSPNMTSDLSTFGRVN